MDDFVTKLITGAADFEARGTQFQEKVAAHFMGKIGVETLAGEIDSFSLWIVDFLDGYKQALLKEARKGRRETN